MGERLGILGPCALRGDIRPHHPRSRAANIGQSRQGPGRLEGGREWLHRLCCHQILLPLPLPSCPFALGLFLINFLHRNQRLLEVVRGSAFFDRFSIIAVASAVKHLSTTTKPSSAARTDRNTDRRGLEIRTKAGSPAPFRSELGFTVKERQRHFAGFLPI